MLATCSNFRTAVCQLAVLAVNRDLVVRLASASMSMSTTLRHASRALKRRLPAPSSSAGARRRYAAAAFARAPVVEETHHHQEEERRIRPVVDEGFQTKYQRATHPAEAGARLAEHLNETFKPLEFPPELAARMLTHVSHRDAVNGHNGRLAFLGMSFPFNIRYLTRLCLTSRW